MLARFRAIANEHVWVRLVTALAIVWGLFFLLDQLLEIFDGWFWTGLAGGLGGFAAGEWERRRRRDRTGGD